MQKIIFAFLMVAGVALAAEPKITDKVRWQKKILSAYVYFRIRNFYCMFPLLFDCFFFVRSLMFLTRIVAT